MSPQQRGGGGGDVARGAGYAALLGALLIGVAVVIGIVLLQIGDDDNDGPQSTAGNTTAPTQPVATTSTTTTGSTSTASTTPNPRPPAEVRVIVLNGGAPAGAAGDMADALRLKGYTNQQPANDWTGHEQTGNSVTCTEGFTREGTSLAIAVGEGTKSTIPYPTPPPPFSDTVDCVVVVGATA
jgi:hypothetical protein